MIKHGFVGSLSSSAKHPSALAHLSQCLGTYLQQGIGLVVVDVVTSRNANLHDALMAQIGTIPPPGSSLNIGSYAVAYRVVERSRQSSLDIWLERFSIGEELPTLNAHRQISVNA